MPVVEIPEIGDVEFPEGMSEAEISSVIEREILPAAAKRMERRAALQAEQAALAAEPEPSTASLFMEDVSKPFVSIPKPEAEEDDTKLTKFAKGAAQSAIGAVEGVASKLGVATLAASALPVVGPLVARAAGLGFGLSAIKHGVEEGAQAFQSGDAEAGGRAAANLLLGSALARVSVQPPKPKIAVPVVEAATKAEASGLPKAAEALKEVAVAAPDPSPEPLGIVPRGTSEAGVGIVPPGTAETGTLINKAQEFFQRRETEALPVEIKGTERLPDFQARDVSKSMASKPQGMGSIPGIGQLLDARAAAKTPVEVNIVTRQFEKNAGDAIAAALETEMGGRLDKAFDVQPDATVGVVRNGESIRVPISDAMEALQRDPNAFDLTPAQRTAFNEIESIRQEAITLAERNQVNRFVDNETLAEGAGESGPIVSGLKDQIKKAAPKISDDLADVLANSRAMEPKLAKEWDALSAKSKAAVERLIEEDFRDKAYFPRQRIDIPEGGRGPVVGGSRIGAKQHMDKTRLFETEQAGMDYGVKYAPSIEARLGEYVRRTYRKIADKRMADDPALKGELVKDRQAKFTARFAGEKTPEQIAKMASEPLFGEAIIQHPAFTGRIFPREIANRVNEFYAPNTSKLRRAVTSLNSITKQLGFGLDYAAPWLQGQALAFSHPTIWAKATANSARAFLDPQVRARFAANPENLAAMRELAQMGSKVGESGDLFKAEGLGKRIGDLRPFKAARRSFESFLDIAKVELWKAQREVTPKEQWPRVAETIENMLSYGRMEEAGMSSGRALAERTLFLAPSYLRGSLDLVSKLGSGGVSGKMAWRAIGSWAAGGSLLFYGLAKWAGLSDEEIVQRLDPRRSDFASIPVKFPDGRNRNVGLGGPLKSLLRLAGLGADAFLSGGDKTGPGVEENPVLRWFRGKLSPTLGMGVDLIVGKDFLGNDITWIDALVKRNLPLGLQTLIRSADGEPIGTAGEVIPGLLGINVYSENIRAQFARERDAAAKERFKKPYEKLGVADQFVITKQVEAAPQFSVKKPTSQRMLERAHKADVDRRERIVEKLSPETQGAVKALNIVVPGYDAKISLGSKEAQLTLTKKQQERLEEIIGEEYEKVLQRAFRVPSFDKLEPSSRQDAVNKLFVEAKQASRQRLLSEIEANSKTP